MSPHAQTDNPENNSRTQRKFKQLQTNLNDAESR